MVESHFSQHLKTINPTELLEPGEVVAVVDDSPEITLLLSHYLTDQGFTVVQAASAAEFLNILQFQKIALVLLDIGLPDRDGDDLLKDIVPAYPDLGIIMVTGTTDIDTALGCLRQGADDYLTKPVSIKEYSRTVINTLKKRRLIINNRRFQRELQNTNNRMQFLHQLNYKMNTAYLNARELQAILKAILIGITADEGLRFNRAFLALENEDTHLLEGRIAIGTSSKTKAGQIWESIKQQGIQLDDILNSGLGDQNPTDPITNNIIQDLRIPTDDRENILIFSLRNRKTIAVYDGKADDCDVQNSLIESLQQSSFVVVPLYSPSRSFGVIIVDNFITQTPITPADICDLEIFASQASLAIEHSYLYEDMAKKIAELELVTTELEKNKDLLLKAERSITINRISSQLLHALRNPITSIGGTARLLTRKSTDPYTTDFLKIITSETDRVEQTLEDLFSYTEGKEFQHSPYHLYSIIRETAFIFYSKFKKYNIEYQLRLEEKGPQINLNENKIRQVFSHLIRNSTEAMENGGVLEIEAVEKEESVIITISDTGPGIPENLLQRVMEPFYTTKPYGNGMGLPLTKQIIAAHKGSFSLKNRQPHGIRATVCLPKVLGIVTK
ncbi:MAG: signal transduction histidine kinase/DNA-binding response OmpR family regulator [Desulforhopalus sp.]|jgi:signal transduction histidine kinase/DNA-binding response OmpR family regulator